jgi:hypothetical protein
MAKSYGKLFGVVAVLGIVESGIVSATTVNISSSAGACCSFLPPNIGAVNDNSNVTSNSNVDGTFINNLVSAAIPGTASAITSGSADIVSGKLRSRSEANSAANGTVPIESYSNTEIALNETFTVSGNGTVSASLVYDGFWSVVPLFTGTFAGFGAQTTVTLGNTVNGNVSADDFFIEPFPNGNTGSAAGELTAQLLVADGDTIALSAVLRTSVLQGKGFVDFSNTSVLSLILSPGITLKFSDDRFLSGATNPSPVPLPAGLPLLVVAIGAFAIGRWTLRKPSTAV